jgi:hypothetical protein
MVVNQSPERLYKKRDSVNMMEMRYNDACRMLANDGESVPTVLMADSLSQGEISENTQVRQDPFE